MASENNKTNYYISSLLRKLQSSSASSVQKALISLSRATRKSDNVVKLRDEGGINLLLAFVQSSNKKALDMAVSVLANCALEKQSRKEIKQLNGLALLCNLLASLADTSILSRVTRALANLSQDVTIANEIVNLDALPKLLDILKESTDVHLLQNTLRALRIMGRSYACIKELAEGNGILSFVELLHKENGNEVKCSCLQTLLELTKAANGVLARQIQEHGGIEVVSQLSYSDEEDITENCINILSTLTRYSSVRVSVGTMGGIEAFIYQIQDRGPLLLPSIEGICMCCREAVNRNKVRSCGGLEVLLDILQCPEYLQVFDNVLGAFACFSYDDLALKRMLASGLIPILVSILQKLLFPESTIKDVVEKQDKDLLATSNKTAATTIPKDNATSKSSESMFKATDSVPTLSSSMTSDSAKSITLPLPQLPEKSYPASPPSCISPNLSPELRVPFVSSYSPQSARSSSPMVYSPSGSEVDDDVSSESDDHQDTVEDDRLAAEIPQDLAAPKSDESTEPLTSNDVTMSKYSTGSSREEVGEGPSPNSDLTTTNENVLSTLTVDLATTHSGRMATGIEGMFKKLDETDRQHCQPLQNEERSFPRCASGSKARVPLLPGTSFNEHLHLFLKDENQFSADQPSPKKVQCHATNRFPSMRRYRYRYRELPKPCWRPYPYPRAPSNSSGLQGIESKIIFLLSRFGQMPDATDSEALISPECIQTLLDYLCYSKNPDSRCVRLFTRLAWERKFFETLIVIMFPGAIYRQLICGLRPGYLLSDQSHSSSDTEFDNKVKESSVRTQETSRITTHTLVSVEEPAEVMPLSSGSSTGTDSSKFTKGNATCDFNLDSYRIGPLHQLTLDKASTSDSPQTSSTKGGVSENNQVGSKSSFLSPLTFKQQGKNFITDPRKGGTMTKAENFSRNHTNITKEIGKSLLSILTTQACTSFGEGILAHLLLRGTQKQKEACALSLPYVCKPLRMKRKLLVDCKGIMVILSILCNSAEHADIIRAVNSITYLIANSALKMDKDFKVFIAKNESQFLIPPGYRVVDLLSRKNRKTGKGSSPTAARDRNVARMTPEDYLRTESTPRGNNLEGRQKFDGRTDNDGTLSPAVCRETERLPKEKDVFHSVINQSSCSSKTAPKRLRHVIHGITCKRTKVESGSTELETCSGNCCYNKTHSAPFDIVVKVDTGESIEAHRSVLCAFSEVFAAMLSTNFIEANQSEVMIKDVNHATVLFLFHYAYGCSWSVNGRSIACPFFEESLSIDNSSRSDRFMFDFDFLLDLLVCADRFLLTGLKKRCEQLMMHSLTGEHVADAYVAAVFYNTPRLRVFSLQYIFLGDLELNCVYNCVVRLLQSQERDRVIEDFKNIALDCCT